MSSSVATVFGWCAVSAVLLAGCGWAAWLLTRGGGPIPGRWLTLAVGVSLSLGFLTLVMFWQGLLLDRLDGVPITAVYLVLVAPGWWLWLRSRRPLSAASQQPRNAARWLAELAVGLVVVANLFNAFFWPFSRPDARGIYHRQAEIMEDTHRLAPLVADESPYHTYPAMIPLMYTYTYLASGWENQYLARTVATLLGASALIAACYLGRALADQQAGWLAVVILGVTPAFGGWLSSGYVDLPAAFFYTLSAFFAFRLWDSAHWTNALLAGLMMGMAAWTKNVALIGVPVLALWLAWAWLNRRVPLGRIVLALAACAAVAAPWYARNLLVAGHVIPDTAWTDSARRTLDNLLILVLKPDIYSVFGWLMAAGLVLIAVRLARSPRTSPGEIVLVLWTVPFFVVWWLFGSYDPRFLLLILPLLAVAGALFAQVAWRALPEGWQQRVLLPAALLVLVLAAQIAWTSVERKEAILANPLMDHRTKRDMIRFDR